MSILGKLTLLVLSLSAYSSFAALPQFKEQSFSFPPTAEKLLVADFNDDELNDLLVVTDVSLRIYFQRDSGFDFENGFSEIDFAGRSVGWDLSNNYQGDGSLSLIAVPLSG